MNDEIETEDYKEGPKAAKPYLDMISDAEKAFTTYQEKCDSIDKKYGHLKVMAEALGDREFQIFWANMEVLKPTIYSRAPRPAVQPRHKDGKELHRKSSELLERVLEMDVEADDLHETLLLVRDDLAIAARGVPWVLDNGECIHVNRQDFVHDPARKWKEVGWVARRAYLTRDAMRERFPGADLTKVKFEEVKKGEEDDYKTSRKKAAVWEMWHRGENKVCWITPDYPDILEEAEPLIDVKGFFPCPKPAYGSLERDTLKPIPDFIFYRDQVDEINELTARMSALAESLRMKGFYAAGASEVGEAIETAMKATDNKAILVPVSSVAALGGSSLKDAIIWLPVKEVAEVITALVALRRQLIEDVYEITGLSDIMRGATEAQETATAQNLKAQFGSVRVRERQNEMVRIARDILRIKGEIYAENVPVQELATMAGMQIPSQMQIQQAMMQQQQQAMVAQQQGQQVPPPEQDETVTMEEIDALLKDQRLRPFVLEIESDSTISPNEEAEKQSRIEFITAMGSFIQQAGAMVAQQPETAPFAAELMKFTAGGFRAGRELGAAIDEFADQVKAKAQQATQQQGPSPEQIAAEAEQQRSQVEMQKAQMDMEIAREKVQGEIAKMQLEMEKIQGEAIVAAQQAQAGLEKTMAEIEKINAETARIKAQASQPQGPVQ